MVKSQPSEQIRKIKELHRCYQTVFGSPEGNTVLNHLCKVGLVMVPIHAPGDPHETSYRDGKRSLVLSILKFVDKTPQDILKLIHGEKDEQ